MKKIVVLYPAHYEQSMGGAEMQIKYFIQACHQVGHEVHYIYEDKGKEIKNIEGVILHPIKKIQKIKFCGKSWFLYRKSIDENLKKIKPDVIYTRLASSWIYFASQYALKNNIKHIHALASDYDVFKSVFKSFYPFFTPIENYYINKGLKQVISVITQNKYQQQQLLNRFGKCGIRVNQMTESIDASHIIKNDRVLTIVWIANLKQIKQPELFVKLAKELAPYSDMVRMIMCGRFAPIYDTLLSEIDNIEYLEYQGELKQEAVFDLLEESDILVNTSVVEGFSNTFVQAWMRKNIVFSLNSNPDDILTTFDVGYLLPSVDLMKDKIVEFLENREQLRNMQNEAYSYVMQNHSIGSCMPKVLDLL